MMHGLRRGLGAAGRRSTPWTNVREVFRSWQREGTVIRSWLLDLAVNALDEDHHLERSCARYAEDSGEGR
ncbi:hypothetical protein STENM36S_05064 [Streptomyces tendae]